MYSRILTIWLPINLYQSKLPIDATTLWAVNISHLCKFFVYSFLASWFWSSFQPLFVPENWDLGLDQVPSLLNRIQLQGPFLDLWLWTRSYISSAATAIRVYDAALSIFLNNQSFQVWNIDTGMRTEQQFWVQGITKIWMYTIRRPMNGHSLNFLDHWLRLQQGTRLDSPLRQETCTYLAARIQIFIQVIRSVQVSGFHASLIVHSQCTTMICTSSICPASSGQLWT